MASKRQSARLDEAAEHWKAGRLVEAENLARKLVAKDKKDVNAHQLLGLIAKQRGWFDQAISHFERCVRLQPDDPMSHTRLAMAQMYQGRFEEAGVGFDRALRISLEFPTAVRGKTELLERGGELEKAHEFFSPIASKTPDHPETALLLASLKVKLDQADIAIAITRPFLDDSNVQPITRRQLHFVTGKAQDRLERHDDAFATYEKANRLAAKPFDIGKKTGRTNDMIAAFPADELARLPRATNESQLPIFIVGMPRSGSTLVEQIIDAHPQTFGAGETTAFNDVIDALTPQASQTHSYPASITQLRAPALDRLGGRYINRLKKLDRTAARIADKNLLNYNHLGLISLLYPKARIIHCRRDPLDNCVSCFINDLSPIGFPWSGDLTNIGLYYGQYRRLIEHWRGVLDVPILDLAYEDLVNDQERTTRRIIEFCCLDWDDACLKYYESGRAVTTMSYDQVRRPVYRTALNRWKRYEKHLEPLRSALTGSGIES